MILIIISFIAGILTVLTPCSFTLLPIILGTSLGNKKDLKRTVIIVTSLGFSVFVFSLLLKATTFLIQIPLEIWSMISGLIIIILSITYIFPGFWENLIQKTRLLNKFNNTLDKNLKQKGVISLIFAGLSLGPIFGGCSPTYLAILSVLLPAGFLNGIIYLIAYCTGLALIMFLVAFLGQSFVSRMRWSINPNGKFKFTLGLILLIFGILIFLGIYKDIESSLINTQFTTNIINFENGFLNEAL